LVGQVGHFHGKANTVEKERLLGLQCSGQAAQGRIFANHHLAAPIRRWLLQLSLVGKRVINVQYDSRAGRSIKIECDRAACLENLDAFDQRPENAPERL
jgi:hypothetical protein